MLASGEHLTLLVDKPAVGGRMIARHEGRVVFVKGAIPGERVVARVDRVERSVAYASVVDVLEPDADRRPTAGDPDCGGTVFAHVAYARQLVLKAEIIADALARIGRVRLAAPVPVAASPEIGYRMRARLHVQHGRVGFLREGTHRLCDAGTTGQLLPAAAAALERLSDALGRAGLAALEGVELSENMAGDARVLHLEATAVAFGRLAAVAAGLSGASGISGVTVAGRRGARRVERTVLGSPYVSDDLPVPAAGPGDVNVRLRRHVRAFFQGNRFLLPALVSAVLARVPRGAPLVDLYAGAGLFAVAAAAAGCAPVAAVEADAVSARDLEHNARPYRDRLHAGRLPVEAFVARGRWPQQATVIVDPPRAGLSGEAAAGLLARRPPRLIYVSCDVATLARDLRKFLDAGYALVDIEAFDLFPNTAHVESLVLLARPAA